MSRIQKIAILSLSLLVIMSSAVVSPGLSTIQDYFSSADSLLVQMVVTLPALFIVPVTLITGKLIFYVKKKKLVYIGLILYIFGGLGGALQNSIYMLLTFRVIMGIGLGILLPLSTGLIADFFNGKERSQMMGYSSAFKNFGGIIALFFGGLLSIYGWRYPFLVYIIGFVVLFLAVAYLPDQPIQEKAGYKQKITKNIWLLGISIFMVMQIFYAVPTSLSLFVVDKGIGTGFHTGILIAFVTLGSLMFGIFFHQIKTFLKGYTVTIGLLFVSFGMLGIGYSNNLYTLGLFLLIIGFGFGILSPSIYLQATLDCNPKDVTLSLAIISSFSFLGQFASPIIIVFIQNITNYTTMSSPFIISFFIGVFSVITILVNKRVKIYVPY
jgi:MFS family permease